MREDLIIHIVEQNDEGRVLCDAKYHYGLSRGIITIAGDCPGVAICRNASTKLAPYGLESYEQRKSGLTIRIPEECGLVYVARANWQPCTNLATETHESWAYAPLNSVMNGYLLWPGQVIGALHDYGNYRFAQYRFNGRVVACEPGELPRRKPMVTEDQPFKRIEKQRPPTDFPPQALLQLKELEAIRAELWRERGRVQQVPAQLVTTLMLHCVIVSKIGTELAQAAEQRREEAAFRRELDRQGRAAGHASLLDSIRRTL